MISHAAPGDMNQEAQREGLAVYERANMQITMRSVEQITSLFEGFQLSPDGVVPVSEWRPENDYREAPPHGGHFTGGVARLMTSEACAHLIMPAAGHGPCSGFTYLTQQPFVV
ncbi:SAM-dependent methyltransferase [Microtetraspora sp. NBRC 16547]|uniref:SAM-dependent methyltransferase n=1 Tax=Microtetraspora sp. NBRC 16547 TaxID=3030993 RepID=UPI0024A6035F|nr:hypothetical protein Misp02_23200 [Microtetraspora sp. NBRC 16547]